MRENEGAQPENSRVESAESPWNTATRVLLFAAFAGLVLVYSSVGISWDEPVQTAYGEHVLDYFLSGGDDRGFERHHNLRYYGSLFELASAALHRAVGANPYDHRSLLTGLVGLLSVAAAASTGRLLGGARVGFLAALVLLGMPRFVGHALFNSKDVPFACGVAWSFYLTARILVRGDPRIRELVTLGLVMGGAMAIRSIAIGLLVPVAGALLVAVALRRRGEGLGGVLADWLPRCGLLVSIAWGVMVAFWPFAHDAPFAAPLAAIDAGHGSGAVINVRYLGRVFPSVDLPGHYLAWSLLIVTPPALTAFALGGVARVGLALGVSRAAWRDDLGRNLALAALLAWALGPVLAGLAWAPNVYDGIRHILFALPGLAVLAAFGVDGLLTWAGDRRVVQVGLAVACVATLWGVASAARHPIAYFNVLAGPARTVHVRYDTDYWVTSYRDAAEWINQRQAESDRPLQVVVAADHYNQDAFSRFLDSDVVLSTTRSPGTGVLPERYDYYVATTRYGWIRGYAETPLVREIRSGGVLLCGIRGRAR